MSDSTRNRPSPSASRRPRRNNRMARKAKKAKRRPAAKARNASARPRPRRSGRTPRLPLDGIRVVEFTHMVMGPTCGMILGDLGAEVIKVEPPGGDKTRKLIGSGAGFFSLFNRNKKSVIADLSNPKDRARVEKLIASADIVSENFRAGALTKHGLDYASLKKKHKRLIYVSHKRSEEHTPELQSRALTSYA